MLDRSLDLLEIPHHPPSVQPRTAQLDLHPAVVSVQKAALAGVVHQPVPVAKVNDLGDLIHHAITWPPSTNIVDPVMKFVPSIKNVFAARSNRLLVDPFRRLLLTEKTFLIEDDFGQ